MRPPRILFVSGNTPPVIDGVGHYTANLVQQLVQQRPEWDWKWLARRPRWFNSPLVFSRGILIARPAHAWNKIGKILSITAVRLLKPDLVHIQDQIHSFHETNAAVNIAEATRAPVITTLHEFHTELPSVCHTIDLVQRSRLVIANDRLVATRCSHEVNRIPNHCWWSPSNIPPIDSAWRMQSVPGLLTTFGQISTNKCFEVVYSAIKLLRAKYAQLHWRIIGPFTPEANPYHADIAQRFCTPWITFTGSIEDIHSKRLGMAIGESQIMLLPFADGASLRRTSLQAAWTFGLPVITTPPQVCEPDIVDGDNCLLVCESTPEAWACAIERLLTNVALARHLRAGSLVTADRFCWERLAKLHLDLYEGVLEVSR